MNVNNHIISTIKNVKYLRVVLDKQAILELAHSSS